jgi:hypothetical protein
MALGMGSTPSTPTSRRTRLAVPPWASRTVPSGWPIAGFLGRCAVFGAASGAAGALDALGALVSLLARGSAIGGDAGASARTVGAGSSRGNAVPATVLLVARTVPASTTAVNMASRQVPQATAGEMSLRLRGMAISACR